MIKIKDLEIASYRYVKDDFECMIVKDVMGWIVQKYEMDFILLNKKKLIFEAPNPNWFNEWYCFDALEKAVNSLNIYLKKVKI